MSLKRDSRSGPLCELRRHPTPNCPLAQRFTIIYSLHFFFFFNNEKSPMTETGGFLINLINFTHVESSLISMSSGSLYSKDRNPFKNIP